MMIPRQLITSMADVEGIIAQPHFKNQLQNVGKYVRRT